MSAALIKLEQVVSKFIVLLNNSHNKLRKTHPLKDET